MPGRSLGRQTAVGFFLLRFPRATGPQKYRGLRRPVGLPGGYRWVPNKPGVRGVPGRCLGSRTTAQPAQSHQGGAVWGHFCVAVSRLFAGRTKNGVTPSQTLAHQPALACEPPHVGRWVCEGRGSEVQRLRGWGAERPDGGCPRGPQGLGLRVRGAPPALHPPPQRPNGHQNSIFGLPGPLRTAWYRFGRVHPTLTRPCGWGGAVWGDFCVAVSRLFAGRTKNGVTQARLWPTSPPWRASPRTSVGGYVKERKKKQSLPGDWPALLASSWRQLTLKPGNKKRVPFRTFTAFARLPTAFRGASDRGEHHPAPVLPVAQPLERGNGGQLKVLRPRLQRRRLGSVGD